MAVDLTENVAAELVRTGAAAHQALMTDIQHNGASIHNLARAVAVRKHDELGSIESRAHSGIMATPVASPTIQQGG